MTTVKTPDDQVDDLADAEIESCLNLEKPVSFFVFAGAGSGKTRSLVKALSFLRITYRQQLQLKGKRVGVITYTNNACDEIKRRLSFDPIFSVSTIHSFVWDLVKGFNSDIRDWLRGALTEHIRELTEEEQKGRAGTKTSIERQRSIQAAQARLENLSQIKKFIYNPNGENRTRDSLNHSEVIKIGAAFLLSKPMMQSLLINQFPVLLIDESQDTAKLLVDAFFRVQATHPKVFCLGLFGDTMQRIYGDGKIDLGQNLPKDWKTPTKVMNHRCPKRIITLINKIRKDVDDKEQRARTNAPEGVVRLFVINNKAAEKSKIESDACATMAEISKDAQWKDTNAVKSLILEHHMAAKRLGFIEMFRHLYPVEHFRTGLLDGTLPIVRLFSGTIYPLVEAVNTGNQFAATAIVRSSSPLLSREAFRKSKGDQSSQVLTAKVAVDQLMSLFTDGKAPRFLDVLISVAKSNLFEIPEGLKAFTDEVEVNGVAVEVPAGEEERVSKSLEATRAFLSTNFSQIGAYAAYVAGESPYTTHQGVKGLEFPRVLVLMDDEEAGGFLFSYEKLFGAKEKTSTDLKNEKEGKETGIDRTRRLFYVTCSRAQQSLGLIAYTAEPNKVVGQALSKGWFDKNEIVIIEK